MRILTYLMILALTSSFVFRGDQDEQTYHFSRAKARASAVQTK